MPKWRDRVTVDFTFFSQNVLKNAVRKTLFQALLLAGIQQYSTHGPGMHKCEILLSMWLYFVLRLFFLFWSSCFSCFLFFFLRTFYKCRLYQQVKISRNLKLLKTSENEVQLKTLSSLRLLSSQKVTKSKGCEDTEIMSIRHTNREYFFFAYSLN